MEKSTAPDFGKVYDEHIEIIYNFVYYKTHHRETAEDITSKVFEKAWAAFDSYDPGKASTKTWLYRLARNAVIDHYRTKKSDVNLEDVWSLSASSDLEIDTDTNLKIEEIKKYLQDLSIDQRDIIIMRVWQGMSYAEIAEVLGKTEAACKMSFSRSIAKLRETMPLSLFLLFLLENL